MSKLVWIHMLFSEGGGAQDSHPPLLHVLTSRRCSGETDYPMNIIGKRCLQVLCGVRKLEADAVPLLQRIIHAVIRGAFDDHTACLHSELDGSKGIAPENPVVERRP